MSENHHDRERCTDGVDEDMSGITPSHSWRHGDQGESQKINEWMIELFVPISRNSDRSSEDHIEKNNDARQAEEEWKVQRSATDSHEVFELSQPPSKGDSRHREQAKQDQRRVKTFARVALA
ncbi:hypothetical protein [Terriglobus saanensis]|uniref:hypothetical protein n=1 Tax=Terriglobus saanensis TaxID=870903 RepID=UPI001650E846|nr:hypothetical protein [Terriglobus saanensis]